MEKNEWIGLANFFFEKRITVHVRTDGDSFYNGLIVEIVGEDFFIINDRMLGETPIAFSQINKLERFRE